MNYPDRHGLLMGGEMVVSGVPKGVPDSAHNHETHVFFSAHSRNRTRDTGIFNPPERAGNVGGFEDLPTRWAANGLTFRERARAWLMREVA